MFSYYGDKELGKKKKPHNLDSCKHRFSYADCSILYFQFILIYEFSVIQPASKNWVIIYKYKS